MVVVVEALHLNMYASELIIMRRQEELTMTMAMFQSGFEPSVLLVITTNPSLQIRLEKYDRN